METHTDDRAGLEALPTLCEGVIAAWPFRNALTLTYISGVVTALAAAAFAARDLRLAIEIRAAVEDLDLLSDLLRDGRYE